MLSRMVFIANDRLPFKLPSGSNLPLFCPSCGTNLEPKMIIEMGKPKTFKCGTCGKEWLISIDLEIDFKSVKGINDINQ